VTITCTILTSTERQRNVVIAGAAFVTPVSTAHHHRQRVASRTGPGHGHEPPRLARGRRGACGAAAAMAYLLSRMGCGGTTGLFHSSLPPRPFRADRSAASRYRWTVGSLLGCGHHRGRSRVDSRFARNRGPDRSNPSGLPIGVQIFGPSLGDRTTIAFAELLEREFGGFMPPPLQQPTD
jgi:hypothetical protein